MDVTAAPFTLPTSQAFFNQFFRTDYPQYAAQSSSTIRHIKISPLDNRKYSKYTQNGITTGHQGHTGQYPPYPEQPRPPQPYPNIASYPSQTGHPNTRQFPPTYPGIYGPRGSHSGHPHHAGLYRPCYPSHPGHPGPPPQSAIYADRAIWPQQNASNIATVRNDDDFRKKVQENERRIIHHLHKRGYDESHPD